MLNGMRTIIVPVTRCFIHSWVHAELINIMEGRDPFKVLVYIPNSLHGCRGLGFVSRKYAGLVQDAT